MIVEGPELENCNRFPVYRFTFLVRLCYVVSNNSRMKILLFYEHPPFLTIIDCKFPLINLHSQNEIQKSVRIITVAKPFKSVIMAGVYQMTVCALVLYYIAAIQIKGTTKMVNVDGMHPSVWMIICMIHASYNL